MYHRENVLLQTLLRRAIPICKFLVFPIPYKVVSELISLQDISISLTHDLITDLIVLNKCQQSLHICPTFIL